MKITKSQLKQIIKEEMSKILKETFEHPDGWSVKIDGPGGVYDLPYDSTEEDELTLLSLRRDILEYDPHNLILGDVQARIDAIEDDDDDAELDPETGFMRTSADLPSGFMG